MLRSLVLSGCLCLVSWSLLAQPSQVDLPSCWPQSYTVQRVKTALTLSTPYYTVQHDLKHGGAISLIRLTHGVSTNLLVRSFETRILDAGGAVYSDLNDSAPRVRRQQPGLNPMVTVEGRLRTAAGKASGIRVKTVYEYRWGYVKIHKELTFRDRNTRLQDLCPVSVALAPGLLSYGYRDGRTENEGAPPFSFGSCRWGSLSQDDHSGFTTPYVPHYIMLADPGVEGLEWFVSSDLAQWDQQLTDKRGCGNCTLGKNAHVAAVELSISAFHNAQAPITPPARLVYDYYLGVPLLEGHALRPWFHSSFNRNRGDWVSPAQIRQWAKSGIQTVHCHNDGDYYDDGLFWRDGSYPPYPDMDKYVQVINECHQAGIRVATYFSNKELHPSTPQFQQHHQDWGRMNRKGDLRHNFFRGKSEFGAQMCLRSGWLDFLKASIDRVLTNNTLDGVYFDWNVALLCCNPRHEKLRPGQAAAGHWDVDELLNLMEWTRRRVGPRGLIIVHNTTTPMFATENFADDVVANEWGYGKWSGKGPALEQLPLEWSLVGARPRGVISYGQLDALASPGLHRLFALEALLAGVTPWPASAETSELFPVLEPIGVLETCRFADWRNHAVTLDTPGTAAAVYSRPGEAWLLVGNLDDTAKQVRCVLHKEKLPYPLRLVTTADIQDTRPRAVDNQRNVTPQALDTKQFIATGVTISIPAHAAVLIHVR